METDMEETAPLSPSAQVLRKFKEPRVLAYIAIALALGAAGSGVYRQLVLKPMRDVAYTQYQSHLALMGLYDLQVAYRDANGRYANDLDTLLMSAPDGAKMREKLKQYIDINTLAVSGDTNGFRFEANVLDPSRTSVKIKGPM
jgi:hypothetical protein